MSSFDENEAQELQDSRAENPESGFHSRLPVLFQTMKSEMLSAPWTEDNAPERVSGILDQVFFWGGVVLGGFSLGVIVAVMIFV